ncbi:MAG: hypothetical protein ACYSUY_18105 [Planctomycetota bacterium]
MIGRSYIRYENSKAVFDGKVNETQWTENKKEVKAFTAIGLGFYETNHMGFDRSGNHMRRCFRFFLSEISIAYAQRTTNNRAGLEFDGIVGTETGQFKPYSGTRSCSFEKGGD